MKRFFVRKAVYAKSLTQALKKEKAEPVSEIYEDYSYVHPKEMVGLTKNHVSNN